MTTRRLKWDEKLRRLREFVRSNGRLPGYQELMKLMRFRSSHSAFRLWTRLVRLGYVRKDSTGKLAPTVRLRGTLRMLGTVAAGFPSPAEEELADILSLDEFLIRRPEATFLLTVTGDSMIEAGIHPGDFVLVERGAQPKNNDIVVAQVDDEWTLKYFIRDQEGVRLDPANRKYSPIRPRRSLVIGGVVRAVIRKYR
ncbi:MAG: transcriptional repressor LexA [Kiritimatiellae bacterium]|nr:transcriptional repressor LexA [Kiritimatiellia bacterium]